MIGKPCKCGDLSCPCQDGDMCHYEGPNPMTPPVNQGIAMDRVSWWYLIWWDAGARDVDGCLGGCMVQAPDFALALFTARILGIDPKGEVTGLIVKGKSAAPYPKNVFISKEELFRIDAEAVRVNSAGERVE